MGLLNIFNKKTENKDNNVKKMYLYTEEELKLYEELKEMFEILLKTLNPREEKVLRLRFGLEDGIPKSLEEVGRELMVSRERIRQIEAKALRKLRHPSRSKVIKDFMYEDPPLQTRRAR